MRAPSSASAGPAVQRFPIRLGRRSRWLLRLAFGVRGGTAWAEVGSERVTVRFGWWELSTPLANVERWRIEGPFRWITAIGVRRSLRHGDVSFAGSAHGGVRMDLRERQPWGPLRIPAIYVGADDLAGFAAALTARGVPGEDARER
jgi:hypothetical protein